MILFVYITMAILSFALMAAAIIDNSMKRKMVMMSIFLCLIILYVTAVYNKSLEVAIFDGYIYGQVSWNWLIIPFGYLIGIAVSHIKNTGRRMIYEIVYGFLVVMILYSGIISQFEKYECMSKKEHGNIRQSSAYSCGPAAAASLMHMLGFKSSEYEICNIAKPNVVKGTNEFSLKYAINRILDKDSASIFVGKINDVVTPCLAVKKLASVVGHWVVIKSNDNGILRIYDPLCGDCDVKIDEFNSEYLGFGIVIRP